MNQRGNLAVQPQAQPRVVRRTRVVRAELSMREKLLYLLGLLVCLACAIAVVALYADRAQVHYDIQALQAEIEKMQESNLNLRREIAAKTTPEQIMRVAQQLNMELDEERIVLLPEQPAGQELARAESEEQRVQAP